MLKKHICLLVVSTFALSVAFTGSSTRDRERLKVEEKEKIERTLRFQDLSQPKEVWVDNIFGSITVEGSSGQEVELVVLPMHSDRSLKLDFPISVGVRFGQGEWKQELQALLDKNAGRIKALLESYRVPLVDENGNPL